jgi:hypothetical protein
MKVTDYRKYLERKVQEETGGELDDKMQPLSVLAILAGLVAMVAVLLYAGYVWDMISSLIN